MSINEELKNLYGKNLKSIQDISDNFDITDSDGKPYSRLDGPILMYCWEEEYEKANRKILFIGQETNTWVDKAIGDIEKPLSRYKEFCLAKEKKDITIFWRAVKSFNKILNPTSGKNCFLWTNVSKYSTWNGKSISFEDHKCITEKMKLLPQEIKIIDPDIVIFFSGPDYDNKIEIQFDCNIEFQKIEDDIPIRELARVTSLSAPETFPENTYRTYHPGALQRQKKWNYLNLIIASIKGYNLKKL